jgi:hypothetical protein
MGVVGFFDHRQRKQWMSLVKEKLATEGDGDLPDMPADCVAPNEPVMRRVYITDATLEAMLRVAGGNPRGLLNYRDEMAGWYQNMSRYNEGSDRPAWLEAYTNLHKARVPGVHPGLASGRPRSNIGRQWQVSPPHQNLTIDRHNRKAM